MRPVFALELTEVTSGWIRGGATTTGARLPLLASWLEDSPRQLVLAAHGCLQGEARRIVWVEEPDSKVWTLIPNGSTLRLLVHGCKGLGPAPDADFTATSEETHVLPRRGFAVSVLAAFDALTLSVPPAKYETEWHHPWPEPHLRDLRQALGNPRRGSKRQAPRR